MLRYRVPAMAAMALCTVSLVHCMAQERPTQAAPARISGTASPAGWTPALRTRIRARYDNAPWRQRDFAPKLTRATLQESIDGARTFLLNNQKPEGNFNYAYDFVARTFSRDDNQVRQAGALWGLAVLHAANPTQATRSALDRGLKFFFDHSRQTQHAGLVVLYPQDEHTRTGTVALVALAIVEYLRADASLSADRGAALRSKLDGYLAFLKAQQRPDGTFSASYSVRAGGATLSRSCYSDGEALLAFCKAAKYLGYKELLPRIQTATATMVRQYVLEAWRLEPDPTETKQFYQWGSMSFWECYDAGWPNGEACADAAVAMGSWMIHGHRTLRRTRNTGYAHEGLVHAFRIARDRKHAAAMADLHYVVDRGLYKLITWQVAGPLQAHNSFLLANPTRDPLAVGGVMNSRNRAKLRIDVTQHQSHAMLLAAEHMYR